MNYRNKYPKLFEEGKIGGKLVKNRVVVTPVGLTYADSNGEVGSRLTAYLEERAKGGAGIVMPGIVLVDSATGKINPNELCLENQAQTMSFAHLARTIHKYDARIFLQLYHPGKCTVSDHLGGRKAWSASEVPTANGEFTKEMTKEDIAYIIERFAHSAMLAKKAGVDGVEIHAAHGYLLNQFLSPVYNKRSDEYGGCLGNRARIVVEIYDAIRKKTGNDFIVGIRVSADEFVEGGNTLEDGVEFAKIWDQMGIDYINVNCGLQESSQYNREPYNFEQGWKKHLAKTVKAAVSCPVIAVNTIKKPDFAESLLAEEVCDFVGLSRGHLADPCWTKKTCQGQEAQIRPCISCLNCMDTFIQGVPPTCTVNPMIGREMEFGTMAKTGRGRKIAVVGGGPGGMEAARILSMRGFQVTLFEESDALGGQLNFAEKPPHKEKITWLKESMKAQLEASGVEVRLNTKAEVKDIAVLEAAGVFICTGGIPIIPENINGVNQHHVHTVPEVLTGKVKLEEQTVVIVGGGLAGLETALYLSDRGNSVTIIEQLPEIGQGIFRQTLNEIVSELQAKKVVIHTATTLASINPNHVVVTGNSQIDIVRADAVVLSLGVKPERKLIEECNTVFDNVRVVGDAVKSGRIIDAITDGFTKAWVFEAE